MKGIKNTMRTNTNIKIPARVLTSPYVIRDEETRLLVSKKDGSFFITKTSGKHKKDKTYNIAPDFIPQYTSDVCSEFIFNYCKANGQMAWLKEHREQCVSESGNPLNIKLRGEFVDAFFKSIRKSAISGTASIFDFIDEED